MCSILCEACTGSYTIIQTILRGRCRPLRPPGIDHKGAFGVRPERAGYPLLAGWTPASIPSSCLHSRARWRGFQRAASRPSGERRSKPGYLLVFEVWTTSPVPTSGHLKQAGSRASPSARAPPPPDCRPLGRPLGAGAPSVWRLPHLPARRAELRAAWPCAPLRGSLANHRYANVYREIPQSSRRHGARLVLASDRTSLCLLVQNGNDLGRSCGRLSWPATA